MIKDGLSEKDALAALTTHAADRLGISQIAGTLQRGKMAHIVMTTAPLFDEKSKIKSVIIDGTMHKYDVSQKKKKKEGESGEKIDIAGLWNYTIEIPGMASSGTMTITPNDDVYDIIITNSQSPDQPAEASGVELEGDKMVYDFQLDAGGLTITVSNNITFDGDTMEGTVSVADFGSFEITGTRVDPK